MDTEEVTEVQAVACGQETARSGICHLGRDQDGSMVRDHAGP